MLDTPGPDGPSNTVSPSLIALGFTDRWSALFATAPPGSRPARVIRDDRGAVIAAGDGWERRVSLPHDLAAVAGDWIAVSGDRVVDVLERATAIVRPRADGSPQVLASNVDLVGVVHGLDMPLNRRRLERGLVLAWESGATPVILLTKADVAEGVEAARAEALASGPGVDVVVLSTVDRRGFDQLAGLLQPNRTLALLGASGAGKSSIANALVGGAHLATAAVRDTDGKGRHTTTHRQLVLAPEGGLLLDTPGLRALTLGAVAAGIDMAFSDINEYAALCRFADCTHQHEPGCAVLAAVDSGDITTDRYEGWRRVRKEADSAALRADPVAFRQRARTWGRMGREAMQLKQGREPHGGKRHR